MRTLSSFIEEQLFGKEIGSDVTFLLSPSNENFPAHKIILARSPVFRAMFYSSTMLETQDKTVIKEEMSKTALFEFLRFLYTDKIDLTGEIGNLATKNIYRLVFEVFDAAHKYQVDELQQVCSKYLRDCINHENVFLLFSQSKLYNNHELERKCLEFIETNCNDLLKIAKKSIVELSYDDMLTLVKNDHLEVNEVDLFGI